MDIKNVHSNSLHRKISPIIVVFAGKIFSGKLMVGDPHTAKMIPLIIKDRARVAIITAKIG